MFIVLLYNCEKNALTGRDWMKKTWWLLPLVLIIALAIYIATDSSTVKPASQEVKEEQSETLRVGFSQAENNNPWRIAETNSIKEEANKRGFELIYTDAQSSSEKQINDVKEILSKDVDYLILAPRQYDELAPALQLAKNKNVPVILIDREAKGIP